MVKGMRIGVVASEYNYDITMMMLERAREHAKFLGAEIVREITVPGVYDMPLAVKKLLKQKDIDGVVALGAVIEGETDHDQVIMNQTSRKLTDLSVEYDKPVGLGISGPGMSRAQAQERVDKAKEAVEAVVKLHEKLK
ncbi:MAG: 6,7-dimethyl-8-ribityllumazine synthase [Thermoplasmata archaeon]